ncbi:hypothetical protein BJX63DRAFT_436672 [Aspergillus granulosus]|uniref:Uncharacterized protein n=1 Tax=Aspergillus granulosus TaxID=176169 RepID=A0ABR4GZ71_9EURO
MAEIIIVSIIICPVTETVPTNRQRSHPPFPNPHSNNSSMAFYSASKQTTYLTTETALVSTAVCPATQNATGLRGSKLIATRLLGPGPTGLAPITIGGDISVAMPDHTMWVREGHCHGLSSFR